MLPELNCYHNCKMSFHKHVRSQHNRVQAAGTSASHWLPDTYSLGFSGGQWLAQDNSPSNWAALIKPVLSELITPLSYSGFRTDGKLYRTLPGNEIMTVEEKLPRWTTLLKTPADQPPSFSSAQGV